MDKEREAKVLKVRRRLFNSMREELDKNDIPALDLLAILAHTTGQCIAHQDMTKVTPQLAMDLVIKNIAAGNMEAVKNHPRPQG